MKVSLNSEQLLEHHYPQEARIKPTSRDTLEDVLEYEEPLYKQAVLWDKITTPSMYSLIFLVQLSICIAKAIEFLYF